MAKSNWEIILPLYLAHGNRTAIITRMVVLVLRLQQRVRHTDKITDGPYASLDL